MSIRRRSPQRDGTTFGVLVGLVAAAFAVVPPGHLACEAPYLTELSPDGRWRIDVCGRPRMIAMPGSGSDAPGWIVLRDRHHAIRGVSSLTILQLFGAMSGETRWEKQAVSRAMVFELPLDPAKDGLSRWWDERIWRWRALLGLTPSDEELR